MYLLLDSLFEMGYSEDLSLPLSDYTTLYCPVIYIHKKFPLVGVMNPEIFYFTSF